MFDPALNIEVRNEATMYDFPVIIRNGKKFGKRTPIALYGGWSLPVINKVVEEDDIESIVVNFQLYIDVEATIAALARRKYQPLKSIKEIDEGRPRPNADLFGQRVA
jgi:hypothetical protein